MATPDRSIPVLPSRSLQKTIKFYERLGFAGTTLGSGTYAILTRGDLELHFFPHPELRPEECYAGCYMRVAEVDTLHSAFTPAGLPAMGIPRLEKVENKPWKMREFALIDEDGNLVKFGKVLQ
jgi:catechol 2,3-dioxygenase-like lactoylglutathione lyase family enzyme